MARPKRRAEGLTARANTRLLPQELEQLQGEAETAGLTISDYVRRRIFARSVVARTDRAVVNELRRLGGLLKKVHLESAGTYSADTAAAINAIKTAIDKLARS